MSVSRDDLRRLAALSIDFEAIGLLEPGVSQAPYFCDPVGAEQIGRLGCDGVHFIFLPEDERVFCVDPSMGEAGTYVLPVAGDLKEFLSFVLFCGDANPISQIWWMDETQFSKLLEEDAEADWPGRELFLERKKEALAALQETFHLTPAAPYHRVKKLQAAFDPGELHFSAEYYDVLGLDGP